MVSWLQHGVQRSLVFCPLGGEGLPCDGLLSWPLQGVSPPLAVDGEGSWHLPRVPPICGIGGGQSGRPSLHLHHHLKSSQAPHRDLLSYFSKRLDHSACGVLGAAKPMLCLSQDGSPGKGLHFPSFTLLVALSSFVIGPWTSGLPPFPPADCNRSGSMRGVLLFFAWRLFDSHPQGPCQLWVAEGP